MDHNSDSKKLDRYDQLNKYDLSSALKHNGALDVIGGKMSGYNGQFFTVFKKNGLLFVMTSRSGETFCTERGVMVSKLSRGRLVQLARALGEDIEGEDDLSQLFRNYGVHLKGVDIDRLRSTIITRCDNNSDIASGSFIHKPMI